MSDPYEPKILAFLCNWCSYAGADLAGVSRIQYPPNIRILRVMCSGRVDPLFVLRAFKAGFDAVMVFGCHPGDCHYIDGNIYAEKKMNLVEKLLDIAGIGRERFLLDWVSAAEGEKFARKTTEFTEKIKALGHLEIDDSLRLRLDAAIDTVLNEKIRAISSVERRLVEDKNVYGEPIPQDRFLQFKEARVEDEFAKSLIVQILSKGPKSVREVEAEIGIGPETISYHITDLISRGSIAFAGQDGKDFKFTVT